MNTFSLLIQDATHDVHLEHVSSFIAEDSSGSFGIQAHHARFMTAVKFGLARFRLENKAWQYLAMPGALLYFENNRLTVNTRHFLIDSDYQQISMALQQQLLAEEQSLQSVKKSLHRMEEQVLRRLWELDKEQA